MRLAKANMLRIDPDKNFAVRHPPNVVEEVAAEANNSLGISLKAAYSARDVGV